MPRARFSRPSLVRNVLPRLNGSAISLSEAKLLAGIPSWPLRSRYRAVVTLFVGENPAVTLPDHVNSLSVGQEISSSVIVFFVGLWLTSVKNCSANFPSDLGVVKVITVEISLPVTLNETCAYALRSLTSSVSTGRISRNLVANAARRCGLCD